MGERIMLTNAIDGFAFDAWRAAPTDARRGGLVICHAIWGVTPHLRELAESYADDGYEVLVPNLFARFGQDFAETNIDPAVQARQLSYGERTNWGEACLGDVQTGIDALAGPRFLIGFCFGGTTAWLAACRCEGLAAVSCFYGGQIHDFRTETPRCPTILHFGKTDELIPPERVEAISEAHPEIPAFLYDAGHGFVAPTAAHHADSARLSRLRTLQLFARQVGRGEA
jgi:carboxymethylenebutenolidase